MPFRTARRSSNSTSRASPFAMAGNVSVDTLDQSSRIFMSVPPKSTRSISPISPSRSEGHHQQSHRTGMLSCMTRRIGRKSSQDSRLDYHREDDSGCSTDSCSSAEANTSSSNYSSMLSSLPGQDDSSSNNFGESQSLSSCSTDERAKSHSKSSLHFRSTSSLRRALRSLSLSTRSLSCTGSSRTEDDDDDTDDHFEYEKRVSFKTGPEVQTSSSPRRSQTKKPSLISQRSKTPPPQRRILRQPVSYLYLKGMSGLATQRVPRSSVCCPEGYR